MTHNILHKILPQPRLDEVVLETWSLAFPVVPGLLHFSPFGLFTLFDRQVLGDFVLQAVVVDLLCDSEGWIVLAVVAEPSWTFFGLGKNVVLSFVEVALKEKMGFLLLASLAH